MIDIKEKFMIYGNAGSSFSQRATIVGGQTIIAVIAIWILVLGGIGTINVWLGTHLSVAPLSRRIVLLVFLVVTYLRITLMVAVFLKRNIGWQEAAAIPSGFALYYLGFSLLGGTRPVPFGSLDVVAIVLFAIGAATNTVGELLRHTWRTDPANRGRLYTGGLFRYSRHANYFGDIVWVSAWALLTRNPWSAIIPVFLFCMFAFYNVPLLDKHLAEKYGTDFETYRKRTKGLIPFLL
jgi:protein-S-isoprenylcysteine O-methyltransferase Ste14